MSCYDLIHFAKRICCQCFRHNYRPKPQGIQSPMIQMSESRQTEHQPQILVSKQPNLVLDASYKKNNKNNKEEKPQHLMKTPLIDEEFHSIDSSFHLQTQKSIRSAKMLGTLDKLQRSTKEIKPKEKKKSQLYASGQWQDTPVIQNLNVQNEIEQVKDWFKKEYGRARVASFRVNHAVRLRMQGQGMLTLLAHKLQDFKIKFNRQQQSSEQGSPKFPKLCNKSKTLGFQYLINGKGESSYKRNKLQKYYEIVSNAPTLQQIIRSFLSKQAMKTIHDCKSIQPVEYEGGNLRIPFPILQVRLTSAMQKEQRVYHLASQMGESSQSKQQQRQIIFVSYSLDQSEQSWQYVIRIFFGMISRIQIYSQTYEDINFDTQTYFKKKYTQVQSYLQGLHIISP